MSVDHELVDETDIPRGQKSQHVSSARRQGPWLRQRAGDFGVLLALVVMIIGFSVWLPSSFATFDNLKQILGSQGIPGIVALAALAPLTAGEFDLSIGATVGFSSVLTAYWAPHVPAAPLFLLVVAVGVVIGTINAFLVRLGVNPFIATLGVSTILTGGNEFVTHDVTLFKGIQSTIAPIAQHRLLGIQLPFYYFLALAIIMYFSRKLQW